MIPKYNLPKLNSDIEKLTNEIDELTWEAGLPGFWDNPDYASGRTKELTTKQAKLNRCQELVRLTEDFELMQDWLITGDCTQAELTQIEQELEQKWQLYTNETLLTGKYDKENAILTFHAGSGGTEAEDFCEMMLRAVVRWCEQKRFSAEISDMEKGTVAGIQNATLIMRGENAYGYAKALNGVFRLVRISPFDAAGRRHTSFAAIDVIPQFDDVEDVIINPDDIEFETMIAHVKAGGQNLQHNNMAVRITHKPSGIVIRYDAERSQLQNRNAAMAMLKARLKAIEVEKQLNEISEIRGEKTENGWGNAICSIVLMPYQLVKDNRTNWESSNTTAFLNGDFDGFINAYLEQNNE